MLIAIYSKDGKTVTNLVSVDEYLNSIQSVEFTDVVVFCSLI